MFYCWHCDIELKQKEVYFDYEENAFRDKECGQLVELLFQEA